MTFTGFSKEDFDTFHIGGLEARMEAIQTRIQPKFKTISDNLLEELAMQAGEELFLHIAKHARRTVNAPVDTWMAFSNNKRGYKQHPHFQIGLFDDHVFIWLALIYELPNKTAIANQFLQQFSKIKKTIPTDFMLSFDHMKKDAALIADLTDQEFKKGLERFRDVKKVELLLGRQIKMEDPLLKDGQGFLQTAKDTFQSLIPLYKMAFV
ncbi:hypothetical protein D3C73_588430 [compost metagenome]